MVLASCQAGNSVMPDTPVGGTDDGPQHGQGMFVSWHADPGLPGTLTDKLSVSEASFQLDHFQIVADSGTSMHSRYLVAWTAAMTPQQEVFHDATAGVYSKASLDLGGSLVNYAYQINGVWNDGKGPRPFHIVDRLPLTILIDCNKTLTAAGSAEIVIRLDLSDPLNVVRFKDLEDESNPIEISVDENPLALQAFRDRLSHGFNTDD
jgi:hypothetical protein